MALSDIYAPPTEDEEVRKNRLKLASKLWQARQSGLSPSEAMRNETGADISNPQDSAIDTKMGTGLTEKEIAGFVERLYSGKYDKKKSVFDVEEEAARKKSEASGAFGGGGGRVESPPSFVNTPNLDRWKQMQSEPVGFRTMSDSRRLITSPAGQVRSIFRKAQRAGVDTRGRTLEELQAMGFKAGGITSQAERERRDAMLVAREQQKRKEAIKEAEDERKRREEEEKNAAKNI